MGPLLRLIGRPALRGCDRPRLPRDADSGCARPAATERRRRHEQGAGAPLYGDATARDCRETPTVAAPDLRQPNGGGGMSREQGPRYTGMRPPAIAARRRWWRCTNCDIGAEASA